MNKNLRICVISSFMGPYYSNYVASMIALEVEFQKRNNSTIYILPEEVKKFSWVDKLKRYNNNLYFIKYAPRTISNFLNIRRIIKNNKIDIIYSRMGGWDETVRMACPFMPIIWHIDMGVNLSPRIKWFKNWLKYKILALWNTHILTVSEPASKAVNSLHPHFASIYIPNALDISRLKIRHGERKNSSKDNVKKLLIFAYSPINKGLDLTLDALEKLNKETIKFNLLVSAQKNTYEYISQRYREKPNWVTLIPPTDDVSSLYEQADAMMLPSLSEGFSYCLAEAIYTGLPVIYSNIPGNLWAGEFRKTYICEKGNSDDIKRAICEFSEDKISEEDQDYNRDLMNNKYSLDKWTEKVVDVLEGIVK